MGYEDVTETVEKSWECEFVGWRLIGDLGFLYENFLRRKTVTLRLYLIYSHIE